jgi:DNA-binding NarL/FixJ family response regulator
MAKGVAMVRVLILDDVLVQREGIAKIVEDTKTMNVVGMAATHQEALAILAERPIDLALVDLVLGSQTSGLEVGREMRQIRPELKVIIYTGRKGMVLAAEILGERKARGQPGLQGYVLTENIASSRDLKRIYDSILGTGYYIDPDVLDWHRQLEKYEELTRRERECAQLVAEGYGNEDIAGKMSLSLKRVENLMSLLYHKFHIPGDPRNSARRVLLAEAIKMKYPRRCFERKVTVLLVDDQPEYLGELREMLGQDERFEVIGEATSGREGIKLAQARRPDLALVDVRMEGLDGFQTTEQMTVNQPGVQVIVISGRESEIYAEEAIRAGAVAFIPKRELTADILYHRRKIG